MCRKRNSGNRKSSAEQFLLQKLQLLHHFIKLFLHIRKSLILLNNGFSQKFYGRIQLCIQIHILFDLDIFLFSGVYPS